MDGLEPTPETDELFGHLKEHGHEGLVLAVQGMARRAEAIVPECIGLSVGLVREGLAFTLVASDEVIVELDATQYLDGGPCVEAAGRGDPVEARIDDLLDEDRWLVYAEASAATGVRSTLSLPLVDGPQVIGGVNLYASAPQAFEGHHQALASALGALAEGAVRNADLSFSTRRLTAGSVPRAESAQEIDFVVGVIMARHGLDAEAAHERLRDAAARAGITVVQAARAIKRIYDDV